MFLFSPTSLLEIVLRSAVVYLVILLGFRLAGKRHIWQLSLLDFALILLVSNAVQNAMVGNDSTVTGGLIAAVTLIAINVLVTEVGYKDKSVAELLAGVRLLLVRNGGLGMS